MWMGPKAKKMARTGSPVDTGISAWHLGYAHDSGHTTIFLGKAHRGGGDPEDLSTPMPPYTNTKSTITTFTPTKVSAGNRTPPQAREAGNQRRHK